MEYFTNALEISTENLGYDDPLSQKYYDRI